MFLSSCRMLLSNRITLSSKPSGRFIRGGHEQMATLAERAVLASMGLFDFMAVWH
jgi:hypothetical protein